MVPDIAVFSPGNISTGAPYGNHRVYVGAFLQGFFYAGFERYGFTAAHTFIGGNDCLTVGVENAVTYGIGGETAEHHRVHRADARAGQHGIGGFGNHRHIQAYAVAFLHPTGLEHVGQAADLLMQLAVADVCCVLRVVAFPDDGGRIATFGEVAVDAIDANVQLAINKPGGFTLAQVALVNLAPGLIPCQKTLGLLCPELIGLLQ